MNSTNHEIPSLIFCSFESNERILSTLSFEQMQKDTPPCIPVRKPSLESFANKRFITCIGNASHSTEPTVPMRSLTATLGCLSPLPRSPNTPVRQFYHHKLSSLDTTKSDIAPTIPQRKPRLHERNQNERKQNQTAFSNKVDTNILLNISSHSSQSCRSTRSTARSTQWLHKSSHIMLQRI